MPAVATQHQSYQNLPQLDTPLVNPDGTISTPWYRVLITLLQRTGALVPGAASAAGVTSTQNGVIIAQTDQAAGTPLSAYAALTGTLLGVIKLAGGAGGAPVPQVLAGSPFVYEATAAGVLIAFSGRLEVSRDSGVTWYPVSLTGGATLLLTGDWARVIWYGATPQVTWFPGD